MWKLTIVQYSRSMHNTKYVLHAVKYVHMVHCTSIQKYKKAFASLLKYLFNTMLIITEKRKSQPQAIYITKWMNAS